MVRGQVTAFLYFKATDQRHIIMRRFWNSTTLFFYRNFCGISPVMRYSTHGSQKSRRNQKNREKIDLQAQFWSASNAIDLYEISHSHCNYLEFKIVNGHKNLVCQLQGHENWAYFYVMEAKIGHFSVFSTSWKIVWSIFFSRAHQKNFVILWAQLIKISSEVLKNCY